MAFWVAIVLTGLGAGIAAGLLTMLLESIQHWVWPGPNILDAAAQSAYPRHMLVLLGAGLLTGAGQFVLTRLTSANGIDITEAISRYAGRHQALDGHRGRFDHGSRPTTWAGCSPAVSSRVTSTKQ